MGTTVRMRAPASRPACRTSYKRRRRRWRFHPRGLIRVILVAVVAINLYVLADNLVRLIKRDREEDALSRSLVEGGKRYEALKKQRDYMQTTEFLRDSAHSLGYIAPGETADAMAVEVPTGANHMVQKKRNPPSPPY